MTTPQLEQRTRDLGQPILESGISRIESKARRVDVDDLVALAVALDLAPGTLLMPARSPMDMNLNASLDITPARQASTADAWAWMLGERSLDGNDPMFALDNRPSRFTPAFLLGGALPPEGSDAVSPAMRIWFSMAELVGKAIEQGISPDALRTSFEQALYWAMARHTQKGEEGSGSH